MSMLPKPTYLVAGVVSVLSWSAQEWASQEPWFGKVPFSMIFSLSLAFLAGLVVQDFFNPESWINEIWKRTRRAFIIKGGLRRQHQNGGVSVILNLEATKGHGKGRLIIRAVSMPGGERPETIAKNEMDWSNVIAGESFELPLAAFSGGRENHHPRQMLFWGVSGEVEWDHQDRSCRHRPGPMNLIIEFKSRFLYQRQSFDIICANGAGENEIRIVSPDGKEIRA